MPGEILAIPPERVAALLLFTAGSYACLAACEGFAFRYMGQSVSARRAGLTSLPANAIANGLGFGLVTGVAVRLQLYRGLGLSAKTLTAVVGLLSASTFVGGMIVLGMGLLAVGLADGGRPVRLLVAVILISPASAWFLLRRKAPLSLRLRFAALAASLGDWLLSAAGLYVLSPRSLVEFPAFLVRFQAASLIGSIVGAPGAIGPLEAATLSVLSTAGRLYEGAAYLVVYRMIFLILPLLLAGVGLAVARLLQLLLHKLRP